MELEKALQPYFRGGRLVVIPRRRVARMAVLDAMANEFEPGRHYPEPAVNAVLANFHTDVCALRRYLVDEGFMDRREGVYWRSGGTVEVN
jgi:hypothetical protein